MTILTQQELARILRISPSFIRRETANGHLPCFAVNPGSKRPRMRYQLEEVVATLRRQTEGRPSAVRPVRKLRWLS